MLHQECPEMYLWFYMWLVAAGQTCCLTHGCQQRWPPPYTHTSLPAPRCRATQVLVAVGETLWVVDDHGATDQPLPPGSGGVAHMALSPNGAFLAVACLDGKLRVMASGEQGGGSTSAVLV
jgi:hypothetical protein